ncbi:ATP-dependent DNA helicase Q-like SIM [Impatiens glandulifera]|uniref:ATP-dependent DNA helicase Q-like SIM n=1 Tax=Impatiens glandulifera TaxID=253017 RepID=UPI001FB1597F|nr:ATP-dependent DNA helicase Q-like SIM [Impatiens glandulifera]
MMCMHLFSSLNHLRIRCDVCTKGPPEMLNVMDDIGAFMQVFAEHYEQGCLLYSVYDDGISDSHKPVKYKRKPDVKIFISKIREQFQKFTASDNLWWQGLARILEDKGFIKEGDEMVHVQIKYPEPTKLGLEWLQQNKMEQPSYVYPEADMLLSMENPKPYSSFSEWGKGWADPEIRRQRLTRNNRVGRKKKKRKSSSHRPDSKVLRRLASHSKRR